MSAKEETITITFKGNKRFKQMLVDRVYELLMEEGFAEESAKPGCGLTFQSSIVPTEVKG